MGIGSFVKWLVPGIIRKPIGAAGKWIGSTIANNAGVIGKHIGNAAAELLPGPARWLAKKSIDAVINRLPSGNVKDTLANISSGAQGNFSNATPANNNNNIKYLYNPSRAQLREQYSNPSHEPKRPREEISMGDS